MLHYSAPQTVEKLMDPLVVLSIVTAILAALLGFVVVSKFRFEEKTRKREQNYQTALGSVLGEVTPGGYSEFEFRREGTFDQTGVLTVYHSGSQNRSNATFRQATLSRRYELEEGD